jgi:YHS domain-containing protein
MAVLLAIREIRSVGCGSRVFLPVSERAWVSMAKDPVCNKDIRLEQAYGKGEFMAEMHYFCSAKCEAQFLRNPWSFTKSWPTSYKAGRNTERPRYIDPRNGHRDIPEVSEIVRYEGFGRRVK